LFFLIFEDFVIATVSINGSAVLIQLFARNNSPAKCRGVICQLELVVVPVVGWAVEAGVPAGCGLL
jgi:hypothetical protein